jgi:alcohol dehydrogenase (cytochrome c)
MKQFIFAVCTIGVAASLALSAQNGSRSATSQKRTYVPVTDEMLWKPDPANWLSWRRTLDGWGYSPLDQIDRNNVSRLKMIWTRGWGRAQSKPRRSSTIS